MRSIMKCFEKIGINVDYIPIGKLTQDGYEECKNNKFMVLQDHDAVTSCSNYKYCVSVGSDLIAYAIVMKQPQTIVLNCNSKEVLQSQTLCKVNGLDQKIELVRNNPNMIYT